MNYCDGIRQLNSYQVDAVFKDDVATKFSIQIFCFYLNLTHRLYVITVFKYNNCV